MTIHTDAIYEGGLLRPLVPLSLQEQEVVSLTICTPAAGNEAEAARQRGVLMAYVAKVESQPVDAPSDGLSNRDHDLLIYGT